MALTIMGIPCSVGVRRAPPSSGPAPSCGLSPLRTGFERLPGAQRSGPEEGREEAYEVRVARFGDRADRAGQDVGYLDLGMRTRVEEAYVRKRATGDRKSVV